MVWYLSYQACQHQLTGFHMPMGLCNVLFLIKSYLDSRIQVPDDAEPVPVGYAGLYLGCHAPAIHLEPAIYIAQNQVNFTFRVGKTQTDILQSNLAI